MIKLIFGNVGSGKTASTVRWMKHNPHLTIVTNIQAKKMKHVIQLKPEMILSKEEKGIKKNGEMIYDLKLNVDFWKDLVKKHKNINVVIDEAHTFFNPRRSMSKLNVVMGDFLALLRRILGEDEGQLILITQLSRRLDIYAREMATDVQYCINHYTVKCKSCNILWGETNEQSDKKYECPICSSYKIEKVRHLIEVINFKDVDNFDKWKNYGLRTYYKRFLIRDIQDIFNQYNTLQWDDLLSNY